MPDPNRSTRPGLRFFLTLVLGATVAPAAGAAAQPPLDLADCRLDGVPVPARCGTLTVFEDRAADAGRTIDLKIVVIPAVSDKAEPDPLFFLAGGPGQAATELAGPMLPLFADVRRTRDLVFVDQRGTGGSGRMEAQTYVSLLVFLPMIPGMATQVYPLQATAWMMLVPALSHQLLLIDVMGGEPVAAVSVATASVATVLLAFLFLVLTAWMLRQEKIIFGRA